MATTKQIHEVAKTLNHNDYDYDFVGLRVQDETHGLNEGDTVEYHSRVWDDNNITENELDGVCAIDLKNVKKLDRWIAGYDGDTILVLGSNYAEAGEDAAELVMRQPVVIKVVRL